MDRRSFIQCSAAAGIGAFLPVPSMPLENTAAKRQFHASLAYDAFEKDLELLSTIKKAGINTVWMAGFFYGHWPYPIEKLQATRKLIEKEGLSVSLINIPLGHPGDSLGSSDNNFPLTPSGQWRMAEDVNGKKYSGTSLHQPATEDNVAAIKKLGEAGFNRIFLDDDFRLSPSPGRIGGCFCADHKKQFLQIAGYPESKWEELLGDVRERRMTRLLQDWVNFTCDELTHCFQAQQKAIGSGELGIIGYVFWCRKSWDTITGLWKCAFPGGRINVR